MIEPLFPIRATELPYFSGKKKKVNKRIQKILIHVIVARACLFHREYRQKKKLTRKNKRPVGHIAHESKQQ